jgi:predicted nucleotidyltransferase
MQYGLEQNSIDKIISIFKNYQQIEKVVLYGSRAKGNYKKGSDIDLTLFGKDLDLLIQHKIEIEIDDLLLPYSIDLSIYSDISNMDLISHIDKVGRTLYKK